MEIIVFSFNVVTYLFNALAAGVGMLDMLFKVRFMECYFLPDFPDGAVPALGSHRSIGKMITQKEAYIKAHYDESVGLQPIPDEQGDWRV